MALTLTEMEVVTSDYFAMEGGKPVDIYFNTSFLLNYLMKQHKGLWERPSGGRKIRIPLIYDGQVAEFYVKSDTVNSDDREMIQAARFDWKHGYGNATIYDVDDLENSGPEEDVSLISSRIYGAQNSLTTLLAGSIYDAPGGDTSRLSGLLACCNETATLKYGELAEDDLVANDGTKPWEGKVNSTTESLTLAVIRTLATDAKVRDGAGGRPDLVVTTEALWDIVADMLQVQQRFTDGKETAKAGFKGLHLEGKDIFPDDYCPSGYMFVLNSNHIGFAIHKRGYFMRNKWGVIPDSPEDKTMKIYFHGNMVVNNRKAHKAHSNLS